MSAAVQRILIAGGTGLIGRAIARQLLQDGKEVVILTRHPDRGFAGSEARPIYWDGKTTHGWSGIVNDMDAVIQLAGESLGGSPWTNERRQLILDSRVDSGKAIVEAVQNARTRPRILIQASAIGYYGNSEDAAYTETDPAGEGWLGEVCTAWENSTQGVEAVGVRRVVVRTGLVLERSRGILPLMALPVRMMVGGKLGSGRQWISWIHIEDEIRAILALLQSETASGPYNLTAPEPVRNGDFIAQLAAALHRPDWLPTPGFAIRLAIGKMSELVLEGQKVLPSQLEAMGFEFCYPTLSQALQAIYSK